MTYDYLIAGIRIRCCLPFALHMTEESSPFLSPAGEEKPALFFNFKPVDSIEPPSNGGLWMINRLYETTSGGYTVYHRPGPGKPPHARVVFSAKESDSLTCEYIAEQEHMVNYSRNIVHLLGLEMLLLRNNGLILHASLVDAGGMGILFTGPSGAGKSTQAELWRSLRGADVLNGDRAALMLHGNRITAWGLPYAGTSGIYRNQSASAKAIVVLRHGTENTIRRLSGAEAISCLYPEITMHRWDPQFVASAIPLMETLIVQIPVWLLECRPDGGAVELLWNTLQEEENA